MFAQLAKYCLLAAVISPVIVAPKFDLSFGKYVFFRVFVELAAVLAIGGWAGGDPPGLAIHARKIARHPVMTAVLVLAGVVLISAAFAFDPAAAFWSTYSRGEGAFQLLHYSAFLFLLVLLFRQARDWERLFVVSLIAGCACVAYGLLWPAGVPSSVYPQDLPIPDNSGFWRRLMGHQFVGSIGNPIWAGSYFVFQLGYTAWLLAARCTAQITFRAVATGVFGAVSCYASILAFLHAKPITGVLCVAIATALLATLAQSLRSRSKNGGVATLAAIASLLFFLAFLLAGSRGPALGFVAAATALSLFLVRSRWRWWLTSVLLAGTLLGCAVLLLNPVKVRGALDMTSGIYRFQYWRTAWTGFLEHPILGWGPENYTAIYDRYGQVFWPVDHAHSILFDSLATTGVLGTAALLSVFAASAWVARRAGLPGRQLGIVAALLVSYVVQGLFTFDWLPVSLNLYLTLACLMWLTMEFAPRIAESDQRRPEPASSTIRRYVAAAAAVLAVAWAGYYGNYLPVAKAVAFQTALDSRLESWDECREAFNRSFLISAPFGQDELVREFGYSVAKLLREKKRGAMEVAQWESYFRGFADALIARKGAGMVRTLEAAGEVETAAFEATRAPVYFAAAESYQRRGLSVNPANLMLLRGQFDLYSAGGRTQEARRAAMSVKTLWPAILTPDPRIEAALPK